MLRALYHRGVRSWVDRGLRQQVSRVERHLGDLDQERGSRSAPVIFYNASTRIHMLSLNAAFSLLASWGLRAQGIHVRYLVCEAGMEQCILGTDRLDPKRPPPCASCLRFSRILFPNGLSEYLPQFPGVAERVQPELAGLSTEDLMGWEYGGLQLGRLCLPGLRWALRRHTLADDEPTRRLYRQYLRSAAGLVEQFKRSFARHGPAALVLFNGITYPEAVARAVARSVGVRVITHEVGLRPSSAYFTDREATLREVSLPDGYELTPERSVQLDRYLAARRQGRFSMAGIRFWSQMEPLPQSLVQKAAGFDRVVVVFTNVVFDTSQLHANVLFEDMFDWLETVASAVHSHERTLFIVRAHPDENRPGKESQETVAGWFVQQGLEGFPNVTFIPAESRISSYHLIELSDLVLVYNSSIGLEASIMGAHVLAAGRARFSDSGAVSMPISKAEYATELDKALADELTPEPERGLVARRFLYRELFDASLDFSDYLKPYPSMPGMVRLSDFDPSRLAEDPMMERLRAGILDGEPFEQNVLA